MNPMSNVLVIQLLALQHSHWTHGSPPVFRVEIAEVLIAANRVAAWSIN